MAKRKSRNSAPVVSSASIRYDVEETFDDSQDEFQTSRDKILLNEEPAAKRRRKLKEDEQNLQPSDEEVLSYDSDSEADNWGASKADYYNADTIETEADALEEEAEARRLQQQQLKSMTEADFGFDEHAWAGVKGPVVEKLPEFKIPATATNDEKMNILRNRYPEFELLAKDFQDLHKLLSGLEPPIKQHALAAYLGALAMYFTVLCTKGPNAALSPHELRDHAVIESLMRSRQAWNLVKDLETVPAEIKPVRPVPQIHVPAPAEVHEPKQKTRKRKQKPVQRVPREKKVDLQSLLTLEEEESTDTEFGDEDPLTKEQAEEKAKKKKSLRFYSSQIVQKASRRGAASRQAGGDDDIPHKERLRERQDRLLKEAEKRGQQASTREEELGDMSQEELGDMSPDDGYYQSLISQSQQKKADKQAKADAYAEAARQGGQVYAEEQVAPDGKRAITYAIQKNKGLMPKRSKDVRNPRVKKRKKYDEKMKKLSSIRQVYKGGEGRGGYGGELTGIKSNVVKSVRL